MANTTYGSGAAPDNEQWYYMDGDTKSGPVDADALISLLESGQLPPDTRVWTKRLGNWSPANTTELVNRVNSRKQTPDPVEEEVPPKKKKTRLWILVILGLLAAVTLAIACWLFFFKKEAPEPVAEAPTEATEAVLSYDIAQPLVYEDDQCAFWIDAIGEKGDYLELDVRCVNKTEDVLSFAWQSTSINGNMFDPLWKVYVQENATLHSSITFPFSNLQSHNLMPGEEIKYILSVFNESQFNKVLEESAEYIYRNVIATGKDPFGGSKEIEGYEGWFFSKKTKVDKSGRPYYVAKDKTHVYFDEIRDSEGNMVYEPETSEYWTGKFYDDPFGRPYYFNDFGTTVYYDGHGFAFFDEETGRNYFYDENGKTAYYGNNGVPEYYEQTVSAELLEAGKPDKLVRADGHFIVHKEFSLYPTGKTADQITRPERVSGENEQIYWDGEKGFFVVLGGTKNVQGYVIHTYVENKTDNYFYFSWTDVTVNGSKVDPDSSTPLRPHSCYYRDILIPAAALQEIEEALGSDEIETIGFKLYALGENLKVPLYPITWEVPPIPEDAE